MLALGLLAVAVASVELGGRTTIIGEVARAEEKKDKRNKLGKLPFTYFETKALQDLGTIIDQKDESKSPEKRVVWIVKMKEVKKPRIEAVFTDSERSVLGQKDLQFEELKKEKDDGEFTRVRVTLSMKDLSKVEFKQEDDEVLKNTFKVELINRTPK
jgi:hypothetical protein